MTEFENYINKMSKYSPILLRTGIAIVFLWFGFSQISNPSAWVRLLPEFTKSFFISSISLIYLNGFFEITFATLLLLGLFTRVTSFLLGAHLLMISYSLGYGPVAARDLSLAIATFAIFLHGADEFCLDKIIFIKKKLFEKQENSEKV